MLYIDGYSHSKITQNNNRNVKLTAQGQNFILSDFNKSAIELQFKTNVSYSLKLQDAILKYNSELLKGQRDAERNRELI